jgi:hypothetical protein
MRTVICSHRRTPGRTLATALQREPAPCHALSFRVYLISSPGIALAPASSGAARLAVLSK